MKEGIIREMCIILTLSTRLRYARDSSGDACRHVEGVEIADHKASREYHVEATGVIVVTSTWHGRCVVLLQVRL